jgi:excisionase family DNA binding protein
VTYGSGASEPRSAARSKASQTSGSVQVGARGRVQASHGIAGFSSPFAAPVLQARAGGATSPHLAPRLLTVREVAERLRVSTATVYALCRHGVLQHVRVANAVRVPDVALAAFLG